MNENDKRVKPNVVNIGVGVLQNENTVPGTSATCAATSIEVEQNNETMLTKAVTSAKYVPVHD